MKKIATDIDDFEKLITGDYIYVDKTEYLSKIIEKGTYFFLSRPRRFGKSLFLDTIKSFYQGKKELFEGLYIANKDWNWEKYPIIHLDFNEIQVNNKNILSKRIGEELDDISKKNKINLDRDIIAAKFNELIEKLYNKYNKRVIVLIDEYDKPIISHLGKDQNNINDKKHLQIAKENQQFLKIFYDNLKPLSEYLELVFMTGVSKFSKLSVFSTLNNLIELDMHPEFSHMLGYTEEELRDNFDEHFKEYAKVNNMKKEEVYEEFKRMYNGFRFSDEDVRVYNPFSIAKALDMKKIDNYWFESGTPSFLIDLIKDKNYEIPKLANLEVVKSRLKAYDITRLQLIPLLFQTGYLTIKEIEGNQIYHLSYPNQEVEIAFSQNLLDELTDYKVKSSAIYRMKKALLKEEYEKFIDYMKSLFESIANLNIPSKQSERESYYHTIFYLTTELLADRELKIDSELLTARGRIDMVIESEDKVYIIEFKANQSVKNALAQIKEKRYAEKYKLKDKEINLIAINFSIEKKNIEDYKVVNYK